MAAQTLAVLAIVLLAVAYVLRRAWRTLRPAVRPPADGGCGGPGCGCGH